MNNSTTSTRMSFMDFKGSIVSAVLLAILMAFSATMNVAVCVAIIRCKKLRIATSTFIFNLCISDILITIFSMSIWLGMQIQGMAFFQQLGVVLTPFVANMVIRDFWKMVDVICATMSILSLTAISVAKYVAITRPLTYKTVINRKKNALSIIIIWLYAFSVASLVPAKVPSTVLAYVLSCFCFLLPLCVIAIAYGKIYQIAKSHAQLVNVQAGRKKAKEIKAAKTIAVVIGTFCICWFPFFVLSILFSYNIRFDMKYANIVKWLTYLDAFLSPLIYTMFDKRFRTVFSAVIMRCLTQCSSFKGTDNKRTAFGALKTISTTIPRYEDGTNGSREEPSVLVEC